MYVELIENRNAIIFLKNHDRSIFQTMLFIFTDFNPFNPRKEENVEEIKAIRISDDYPK